MTRIRMEEKCFTFRPEYYNELKDDLSVHQRNLHTETESEASFDRSDAKILEEECG